MSQVSPSVSSVDARDGDLFQRVLLAENFNAYYRHRVHRDFTGVHGNGNLLRRESPIHRHGGGGWGCTTSRGDNLLIRIPRFMYSNVRNARRRTLFTCTIATTASCAEYTECVIGQRTFPQ